MVPLTSAEPAHLRSLLRYRERPLTVGSLFAANGLRYAVLLTACAAAAVPYQIGGTAAAFAGVAAGASPSLSKAHARRRRRG